MLSTKELLHTCFNFMILLVTEFFNRYCTDWWRFIITLFDNLSVCSNFEGFSLLFKFNFFELFYIIINHSFIWPLLITCREVVCRRYAHKRYLLTRGRATKTMGRQLRSWDSWGNLMLSIKNWKSAYFSYRACKEHSQNTIFWLEFPEILSQNHMLSLTECVWNFQNDASWDTH